MNAVARLRFGAALSVLVATLVVGVGCNSGEPRAAEGKTIPKGRILKNGLPLQASEKAMANMPDNDAWTSYLEKELA